MKNRRSPWIVVPQPRPVATQRLLCLPHAGGGIHHFVPWALAAPQEIELGVVQLPGRGARTVEPAHHELHGLIAALTEEVVPLLDRPLVLFGHSLGGLLAFELARALRGRGQRLALLCVSGMSPPPYHDGVGQLHLGSNQDLVDELRQLGGTPPQVFEQPELLELIVQAFRADLAVGETYRYRDEPPLECPILAMGGRDDSLPVEELQGWQRHTHGALRVEMFSGGHFYLHDAHGAVLQAIVRASR